MKHKLLILTFAAILLLGGIHLVASWLYLYLTIGWFDNLTHFLGGFSSGLLSLWIIFDSGIFKLKTPTAKQTILVSVLCIIVVGVGWEIFEYLNGLTQSTEGYPLDTMHDLISDIAGAVIAGDLVSRKNYLKQNA